MLSEHRDFKFGTPVGYIKSYQTNKKITPMSRDDPLNFLHKISPERLKRHFKFLCTGSPCDSLALGLQTALEWAWSRSRDVFKFCEISDNNSKTVQDRRIVSIKVK